MAVKTKSPKLRIPADAPTKFIPVSEQRFRTEFRWTDASFKQSIELEVVIMTAAEWLEFPERVYCNWGAKVLDNGMVIAACMKHDGDDGDNIDRARNQIENTESIAAIRHFRSRLFHFLESEPDLDRIEMTSGGDARCEFRIGFKGVSPDVTLDVDAEY